MLKTDNPKSATLVRNMALALTFSSLKPGCLAGDRLGYQLWLLSGQAGTLCTDYRALPDRLVTA